MSPTITAVMVDLGFYLRRAARMFGKQAPGEAARRLHRLALDHLNDDKGRRVARLHRIFVYDAPPVAWKGHSAVTRRPVNLSASPAAKWRTAFHDELRGMRKVAVRMGEIPTNLIHWQLRPDVLKALLHGARQWASLIDDDFQLGMRQKGVDMRLGLDIAALAYRRQVNQIVLVSGDADFVPAAKLARREGIDFILDPMWSTTRQELFEQIDGLRSVCPRPNGKRGEP